MKNIASQLQRIADGVQCRVGLPCLVSASNSGWIEHLSAEAFQLLEMDLATLVPERIVLHFPHDRRGRFLLKTNVFLNSYQVRTPLRKDRSLCLVVSGPSRRSDDQILRVDLEPLIVENQSYRWHASDWFWKGGKAPRSELMGVRGIPGGEFVKAASACQFLQDHRCASVLKEYQIACSDDLNRTLLPSTPSDLTYGQPESWHDRLHQFFESSAPWNWSQTMQREADRLKAWIHAKKGRRSKQPELRLVNMPGSYGARRPALYLTSDKHGENLRLSFQYSASNKRLYESGWKRPLAIDFLRHGIDSPILESYPNLTIRS